MPVIEYKCPSCGSSMVYDSEAGMLTCRSCGRQDNIEQLEDPLIKQTFTDEEAKEYHCNSCGAVLITEAETTATTCSFCGSSVVLADRLTGKLAPVKIIPFAVSKEEAIAAFKKWCRNGLLTPQGFMNADRIKRMTGMYVPFWLYDVHNQVEVHATATKVRTYTRGDYRITETSHYNVYRELELGYRKLPVDASEKMDDELMDKLEPFPYEKLKPFKTPYLAGYIAEKYNYDDNELVPRMKQKMMPFIDSAISAAISGYTTVNFKQKHVDSTIQRADYVLLPVWVVHYDFDKKEHTFAMNGQTGKVVGKPPISMGKVSAWFSGIAAASFLSLKLIAFAMGGGFW